MPINSIIRIIFTFFFVFFFVCALSSGRSRGAVKLKTHKNRYWIEISEFRQIICKCLFFCFVFFFILLWRFSMNFFFFSFVDQFFLSNFDQWKFNCNQINEKKIYLKFEFRRKPFLKVSGVLNLRQKRDCQIF